MKTWMKRVLVVVIVLAAAGGVAGWYMSRNGQAVSPYRTAEVARGDIVVTISATGTIEPEEVIDVGAQVAGQIVSFGKDEKGKVIDYGSAVKEGMVLAKIDDCLWAADLASTEAQLAQAKAGLLRAQADLIQLQARLEQARRDWERAQKLGPSAALAESAFDAYKAAFETTKANVSVGEASVGQAKATISQVDAAMLRARRNLGYCTITAPVDGVIIDRRVNIGQTVVASLNAPSLFLIAKDLKRMQIWVAVNEADIGKIRPGQPVTFTVDAFPGETFRGEVNKVRLNASMTQNVVTYTVEVNADNSNNRLLPYLTASVNFEVARRTDVLLAPNAALRWKPDTAASTEAAATAARTTGKQSKGGRLWVTAAAGVKPLMIGTGLTDGTKTEVSGEDVTEGMAVVVGTGGAQTASASGDTRNPFLPKLPARQRGSGPGGPPM